MVQVWRISKSSCIVASPLISDPLFAIHTGMGGMGGSSRGEVVSAVAAICLGLTLYPGGGMIGWPVHWHVRLNMASRDEGTQLSPSGQHLPSPAAEGVPRGPRLLVSGRKQ